MILTPILTWKFLPICSNSIPLTKYGKLSFWDGWQWSPRRRFPRTIGMLLWTGWNRIQNLWRDVLRPLTQSSSKMAKKGSLFLMPSTVQATIGVLWIKSFGIYSGSFCGWNLIQWFMQRFFFGKISSDVPSRTFLTRRNYWQLNRSLPGNPMICTACYGSCYVTLMENMVKFFVKSTRSLLGKLQNREMVSGRLQMRPN